MTAYADEMRMDEEIRKIWLFDFGVDLCYDF